MVTQFFYAERHLSQYMKGFLGFSYCHATDSAWRKKHGIWTWREYLGTFYISLSDANQEYTKKGIKQNEKLSLQNNEAQRTKLR